MKKFEETRRVIGTEPDDRLLKKIPNFFYRNGHPPAPHPRIFMIIPYGLGKILPFHVG